MEQGDIDLVLYWVDSSDPEWLKEKEYYERLEHPERKSNAPIRFQSWDNLPYLFRGIEKFMPWVRRVFFVTWGHLPAFLRADHPRLRIVRHSEFIPSEYLPTFNSSAIEMNFFRIKELSENFIIFNDDCFPIRPVEETYYFRDGMVCDEAVENIITTAAYGSVAEMGRYSQVNNMFLINRHFKKRQVQKANYDKWFREDYGERLERTKSLVYWNDFPGFYDPHVPFGLKKSVMAKIWELEEEALDKSCKARFRSYTDITQYAVRYWQLCKGNFYPRPTVGRAFFVDGSHYQDAVRCIGEQAMPVLCINENCSGEEFDAVKTAVNGALAKLLPVKSSFEK